MQQNKVKRVAVITGFFQSPHFLKTLFEYLNKQVFKEFDVYVYNYSLDDLENKNYFFKYQILKLKENVGFAGGNNYAIQAARLHYDYDYYALINDDTKPDENWLNNLVKVAASNTTIGAVTSKMLYYEPFVVINGETQAPVKKEDTKKCLKLYENTGFEGCTYSKRFYLKGFFKAEEDEIYPFRWVEKKFELAVPVSLTSTAAEYKLKLFIRKNKKVDNQHIALSIGKTKVADLLLEDDQLFYEVNIPATTIATAAARIIQNAGSDHDKNFNGFDVGSGEIDRGQYDVAREVTMFCGGACLLTKEALRKTGLFNGHYFSYYEDSDLSLRLRRNGFKIVYSPEAVVLHHHAGSGKEWSAFFTYYVFRNKIIFSTKNFGVRGFSVSLTERLKETWIFLKWVLKDRFKDPNLKRRLKLNYRILVDSMVGIIKYKPTKF